MHHFSSPQPSTSAHHEQSDISALVNDLNDSDDEWLNNVSLEDASSKQPNSISQLNHSSDDFDNNSGDTWIFPIGYEKREYQLNISRSCLFTNTLVCLPTGLGKTFIASVVIYNFYRWFPRSKIIFMAHSRPLVHQQIDACYKVVGIPPSETAELTGKTSRDKRMEIWNSKRVFFATPQVIQNDISDPAFPTNAIRLVIVDEAHKAKGRFSYCEVIKGINNVSQKFRVVALSATPGKSEDVIEIIKNLLISKIEVRTEKSDDVKKYTFEKDIQVERVKLGELTEIRDRFIEIYDPYLRKLIEAKAISANHFNKGFLIKQQKDFQLQSHPQKSEINKLFAIVISLLYSLDLLERHGLQLFLNSFTDDSNVTKLKYFVGQDRNLKDFLDRLKEKYKDTSPLALNINPLPKGEVPSILDKQLYFGHQKYDVLKQKLTEYFNNGGAKVIIFCEYRDTVKMVYTLLLQLRPTVLPRMLMGQSAAVSQKDQMLAMKDFRSNKVNVLVTTSVCEEGIDVGEVDLVICFDISSKNPTRFVQRIGRTGRKRNGKVLILATEGKEEEDIKKVIGSKDKMNKSIHGQKEVTDNLYRNAPRLIPNEFRPKCVETKFSIPVLEVESKPDSKAKKTAGVKRRRESAATTSTRSIAAHFARAKKPSNGIPPDHVMADEILDDVIEVAQIVAKPPVTRLASVETLEQIKRCFLDNLKSVAAKAEQNLMLMTHVNWQKELDLKAFAERSQLFDEDDVNMNDSISLDTSWKNLPDDSLNLEKSCEILSRFNETKSSRKIDPSIVETQEEQFVELESRYGNQFSIPEPFNTPFKSSPVCQFNKILNTSSPQPGPSLMRKTLTAGKTTPMKDSPLLRAFQKQRNISSSTPVSSRLTSSFQRTPSFKTESEQPLTEKTSTTLSSSSSKQNTASLAEKSRNMTAFEFFGITSIDDIFVNGDSEEEDSINELSRSSPVEDSLAKLLDQDNDVFLNIPIDDEVIESSIVDEVPLNTRSIEAKSQNIPIQKFELNLEDIFVDSEESSEEHEKNIVNLPSDLSQATQEYCVDNLAVETSLRNEDSSMKENVQTVNSCIVEITSPPPKSHHASRPRPNFSKLLNALKSTNFLSPSGAVTGTSSAQKILQDSSNIRKEPNLVMQPPTTLQPRATSREPSQFNAQTGSFLPSSSGKISHRMQPKKKVSPPKITNFLINSSSPAAATAVSMPANCLQVNEFHESVVGGGDESEEISPIVPAKKKVSRKRKRNNHFIDTQAEVDGSESSDDEGDMTTLDGFIANETMDETHEIDNHALYLQSMRSPVGRPIGFKIPQLAPAMSRSMIFSQAPQPDDDDDWEMGSFIVDADEDHTIVSEPDELEIAERLLKEKRKRAKQQKNGVKRRKVVRMEDSSDEDELEELRKQLHLNE